MRARDVEPQLRGSCCLHGVVIESPLALGTPAQSHGTSALELGIGPSAPVPVEAPPGELLVDFSVGAEHVYTAADGGSEIVLRIHGLCDFAFDNDLRRVECRPESSADPGRLALVARGAMLAFYLGLKGHCVLHASAVEVGSPAVAFVGTTGMGKSTLAAWACSRGARLVTDDLLRIGPGSPPWWVGRSHEIRLRPRAADVVEAVLEGWGGARTSADGRLTVLPPGSRSETGALCAVVIPRPTREISTLELRQLDPVEATLLLSAFPRLEGWRSAKVIESQLDGLSRLTGSVPVFVASVPWGPPFDDTVVEALLGAVTANGSRSLENTKVLSS
ncbi:MAG TPA: hypothetical protein VMR97_05485 [Acidimicrobiales bacterium]|nr:hypothetical protein [Acidimicrobiales bacterium]